MADFNMKKYLFLFALALLGTSLLTADDRSTFFVLTPNSTTVTASSTNSTEGTGVEFYTGAGSATIYVTAEGTAATTNGFLRVFFSTASGVSGTTNNYDTPLYSNIKVSFTNDIGANTVTLSDWFNVSGRRYIKIGRVENTFKGNVSNLTVRVGVQ